MVKKTSLTLVLMLGCIVACDKSRNSSLFPLEEGLEWGYQRSLIISEQFDPVLDTLRLSNKGRKEIQNNETQYTSYVRRSSDGTDYYHIKTDAGVERVAKRTVVEIKPRFDLSSRMVMPKRETLRVGHKWTVETIPYVLRARPGYSASMAENIIKMTFEIQALDASIEVPAGFFEGCLKVQGYASLRLMGSAVSGFVNVPVVQTEWYAPGVGLVKLERTETIGKSIYVGGKFSLDLESFSY